MKRYLVLGGGGYVGSRLAEALVGKQSDSVFITTRKKPHLALPNIRQVDLFSYEETVALFEEVRPTDVFHCAGSVHFGNSTAYEFVRLASNVIAAIAATSLSPRIVNLGSAAEYEPSSKATYDEAMSLGGMSVYGVAKYLQWRAISQLARLANIEVMNARIFNILGPDMNRRFLPINIAHQIASGTKTLELGNLAACRDYVYIDDVIEALRMIMERGTPGEAYNVSSGIATSVSELATKFAATANVDLEVRTSRSLMRENDHDIVLGRNKKILEECGWRPRIEIKDAVELTYKSFATAEEERRIV